MNISRITPYGKTRSKVLFDEGLVLILYNGELKRYHLEEGGQLSEETFETRLIPVLAKRARERLVYILKNSDKTESELRQKLKETCYPQVCIDDAIDWAKSKHYIDDARYAENYIRWHSDGKSRRVLLQTLMQKGISRELAMSMLEEADVDESAQIQAELAKRRYSPDMDEKEKQKIIAALARKGYSWGQISEFVR